MTLEAGSLADDYHVFALEWEADQASLSLVCFARGSCSWRVGSFHQAAQGEGALEGTLHPGNAAAPAAAPAATPLPQLLPHSQCRCPSASALLYMLTSSCRCCQPPSADAVVHR